MSALLRGWARRFHELCLLILRQHTAPEKAALAVLCGCIIGATPLFGLHLPICLLVALCLRLNKVIVYGAANISIPPLIPLLSGLSIEAGELLLHGRLWKPDRQVIEQMTTLSLAGRFLRGFFPAWLLGGVVVGAAIGLPAAVLTYAALRRRQRAAQGEPSETPALPEPGAGTLVLAAIEKARARYDGQPPRFRYYARIKYRMDPCYRAILALVPARGQVVDLGTGLGMLPVALGELGEGRRALGVEWDAAKAACGAAAAAGLADVEIVAADIRTWSIPPCDAVTLVDVLHYYDAAAQRELLRRAVAALRPGGAVLIREADPAQRGGAAWTRAVERWMVRLRWNRGPAVGFRPLADLLADLGALGLLVEESPVAGALHPGNVLIRAVLPGGEPLAR